MSDDTLKRRVAGSLLAVELMTFIKNEDFGDADYMRGLIDRIERDSSSKPIDDVADVKPEPIARLAAVKMPFGAHKNKRLDEIPIEYLDWLCRSQEEFYRDLRAYLKHPELENRIGHNHE